MRKFILLLKKIALVLFTIALTFVFIPGQIYAVGNFGEVCYSDNTCDSGLLCHPTYARCVSCGGNGMPLLPRQLVRMDK